MAQQIINNGTFDNDPSAEKIRTAFDKVNENFDELYSMGGGGVTSIDTLNGVQTLGGITASLTEKTTIVDNDLIGGADSEASNASKKWKFSTMSTYVLGKLGDFLWALTANTTPVDADTVTINDTADSNNLKKVSLTNLWANYFKGKADSLYLVPQDTITTTVSITTATATDLGYSQSGRNILIKNGANAINIECLGGQPRTYQKGEGSTGAITFIAGTSPVRTLVQVSGTAVLNGAVGSIASLTSDGTTDFLTITNF